MANKKEQKIICLKYGVQPFETPITSKIGIDWNVKNVNAYPINGLRHPPVGDTSGWYIWAGEEYSLEDDFFVPLHIHHLKDWRPEIIKYLSLPPGYRFLIAENDYEDVWFDESLLSVE